MLYILFVHILPYLYAKISDDGKNVMILLLLFQYGFCISVILLEMCAVWY